MRAVRSRITSGTFVIWECAPGITGKELIRRAGEGDLRVQGEWRVEGIGTQGEGGAMGFQRGVNADLRDLPILPCEGCQGELSAAGGCSGLWHEVLGIQREG